jgi:hypothetical protein
MKHRASHRIPSQQTEHGFALPIAVGMGMIALLLGLTSVLRSQDDRVDSINKRVSTQSLLAAETGIARVQDFINRYRMVANFNACNSDAWSATDGSGSGNCTNTGSTVNDISWANSGQIPNLNAVCGTGTLAESRTAVSNWTKNNWQLLDSTDASKGEYRLVSYNKNGTLTVEGVSNRGQSGEGKSVITATLPIFPMNSEQIAGLWVKTSISGSATIESDIVGPCTGTLAIFPASGKGIIRTQMTMPNAPGYPSPGGSGVSSIAKITNIPTTTDSSGNSVRVLPRSTDSAKSDGSYDYLITSVDASFSITSGKVAALYYNLDKTSDIPSLKLPRLKSVDSNNQFDDIPDSNGTYNYIVSSLDSSLEFVPGYAVNIWVKGSGADPGNIDLSNKSIVNPCSTAGAATSCGPFDVRIYGSGSSLTLNQGTAVCDVFFHLPTYAASFNSGGSTTQDCGGGKKNTGVYWVDTWSSGIGDSITSPRVTWQSALDTTFNNDSVSANRVLSVPPPRIGPMKRWDPELTTSASPSASPSP